MQVEKHAEPQTNPVVDNMDTGGDGTASVQAGAGVVLDSDPESERVETVNKAAALFRAAEDSLQG